MAFLNINTDEVVSMTNKLEKMHKSALPLAIRGALNGAAVDVKKRTLLKTSDKKFTNRQKNFFKVKSKFNLAKGFDVNSMKSIVGIINDGTQATDDLQKQEYGGTIKGRTLIPMDTGRTGNSHFKNVRKKNKLDKISKLVFASKSSGKNKGQRFIKAAHHAGKGGYVVSNFKGKNILWRVNSLSRTKSGKLKLTGIYSFKKKRSVTVKKTGFMKEATLMSQDKIGLIFLSEAAKQIKRLKSK